MRTYTGILDSVHFSKCQFKHWMPLPSAAVSRVLRHTFPPPLNPVVEKTTYTLRNDTEITKSWGLVHKTRIVISAIEAHTYIHTYSYVSYWLQVYPHSFWPRIKLIITYNVLSFMWKFFNLSKLEDAKSVDLRVANYFKLLTVREPLERLVSAYKDKLETDRHPYYGKISSEIHETISKFLL